MATTKWVLDPTHSEIGFKVKHLMITNVKGNFTNFQAAADTQGDDFTTALIHFTAAAGSVNTGNEQRDAHLKSSEFFDAEQFPELSFEGTKYAPGKDEETFMLEGNLTIKGLTKKVTLEVEYGGIQQDPWGNTKAGFTLSGKINRKDWNLNWNAALESGGVLVSEEVRLMGEIQLVKQVS